MKSLENKHSDKFIWSDPKEYIVTHDQFIFEKKSSSSEKPNNFKIKYCIICGSETTGTICGSDECYNKFEQL